MSGQRREITKGQRRSKVGTEATMLVKEQVGVGEVQVLRGHMNDHRLRKKGELGMRVDWGACSRGGIHSVQMAEEWNFPVVVMQQIDSGDFAAGDRLSCTVHKAGIWAGMERVPGPGQSAGWRQRRAE